MARTAAREVNTLGPRIAAEGIRREQARTVSGRKLILAYSLVSLRVAELEAELGEQRIRPMIVHPGRRAETQEAPGLF